MLCPKLGEVQSGMEAYDRGTKHWLDSGGHGKLPKGDDT